MIYSPGYCLSSYAWLAANGCNYNLHMDGTIVRTTIMMIMLIATVDIRTHGGQCAL